MPTTIPRAPSLDSLKRRTYRAIALLVSLLSAVNIAVLSRAPVPDSLGLGMSGVALLLGVALGLALVTQVAVASVERVALWLLIALYLTFNLRLLLPGAWLDRSDYGALLLVTLGAAVYLRFPPRRAAPLLSALIGVHLLTHWWPLLWPLRPADATLQLTHDLTMLAALSLTALLGAHRSAWVNARESALAMRDIALSDDLTGLPNRRAAYRRFDDAMRGHQSPVSVLLLDIDNFKRVNDTHGHEVGDLVIVEITRALQGALGKSGLLVRWGGEEYLALLDGSTLHHALREGEAMRAAVERLASPHGPLTISVGAASRVSRDTVQSLVHRADQGLYRAKGSGKNRVVAQED